MIFAVLLCAVELLRSEGLAAQSPACVPSHEVECFFPADYLNASGSVSVKVSVGKKLVIPLDHFSESSVCHWIRETEPKVSINGSQSMVLLPLSEGDSGEYILTCESSNGSTSSMTVSLHVMKYPSKPKLALNCVDKKNEPPYFTCISDGNPKPSIQWSGSKNGQTISTDGRSSESKISSSEYHDQRVMCCATNDEGQECSQLYDYDLETEVVKNYEVSNVTVSPGQPLMLRCTVQSYGKPFPVWEMGNLTMSGSSYECSELKKEICMKNYTLYKSRMTFLYIASVSVNHTGTYTCRSPSNKVKSVYINVQAEAFLTSQLDERKNLPAQNASSTCLQAHVSYHPVLQHCSWEAPDKTVTKCIRDKWVTKHRTVKLCKPLVTGDYKLHLQAGEKKEMKHITVCVVDPPKIRFSTNEDENTFTFKTVTLVPANYSWMLCPSANDSDCESDSSWDEINFGSDLNVSCSKTISSSVRQNLTLGRHYVRFCLTNSIGSWCQTQLAMYHPPLPLASLSSAQNGESSSLMVLKVGSVLLLLALAVVSMMLAYFVKKKKPQYQPQLQMIQMVGPNDNDYIYINFKEFEYNKKWEFPRENLELGKELGSGAFGMVVEATAYGISKPGVSQQVAVKMLKEKHQTVEKEALMSELKMLTHIGHHVNIVNLLGACTDAGPTYLIFQYCCHGDLLNYLKTNRENYHKSVTEAFNNERFRSLYHNLKPRKSSSEEDSDVSNYMPMYPATTRGQEDIALLTLNSADMDSFETLESFENPDDPAEDLQTLTFDDLLSFAFQVAKGMEFLSSKNCIHRDLAARNVLVTKSRLVKIGDFGLARDINNDSNYVVRGNVRLPVKWMAPESTFQGIYTMKSDVWAYGILLWEIFSLGVTPYPGMKVDHTFYSMIERGFKMECPYYADQAVYGMMCKCWALDPCNRPSFSKLVSFMCDQLMDREEKLYHNVTGNTSSVYQNAADILDISALATQSEESCSQPDYRTQETEGNKAEMADAVAAKEKLLETPDVE
ncbi:receptor-type tyrosine-protein kinase FLT3-like [Halichoeres trimaculatus]|uniref:receptor-type tyrosine-protein kinase FLT3-like n=1 Tax=Halichoeres trimaculatus TaxID=147232 RepID=UPI003D9E9C63